MNKVSHVLEFYADLNVKYESFDFVLCNDIQTWGEKELLSHEQSQFLCTKYGRKNTESFQAFHSSLFIINHK